MGFIGDLLSIIAILAIIISFIWGFRYLVASASKFTGKTYVFKGGGTVTPHDFDFMTEQLESGKKAISNSVKSLTSSANQATKKAELPPSKEVSQKTLEYLEMLGRLRQSGTLTEEEFNDMKRDILK